MKESIETTRDSDGEMNRMLEGEASPLDFITSSILMTITSVPIALTGVPIHYAGLAGMAITFSINVSLWWARGIPPMDYLWHGFDTDDAEPILSGGSDE